MQLPTVSQLQNLANNASESQLSSISEHLNQLKQDIVKQNVSLVQSQIGKLSTVSQNIAGLIERVENRRDKCETVILHLKQQTEQLNQKVSEYKKESSVDSLEDDLKKRIATLNQEYIQNCKQRIIEANAINLKEIRKIDLGDRKSQANEVFKWVLVAMYGEPESKFYWPNFEEEALKKDNGEDLIERLGKINALTAKQEQRVKTESFLDNFPKIIECPEFKKIKQEIDHFRVIAEKFSRGYHIAQEIKQCEKNIEQHREKTLQKDEEAMKMSVRADALSDRITIHNKILEVFKETLRKLKSKIQVYNDKIESGKKFEEELSQLNKWIPIITIEGQRSNHCQDCSIF